MLYCPKHPRYRAIRPPRGGCPKCWEMFNEKHPHRMMEDAEIFKVCEWIREYGKEIAEKEEGR